MPSFQQAVTLRGVPLHDRHCPRTTVSLQRRPHPLLWPGTTTACCRNSVRLALSQARALAALTGHCEAAGTLAAMVLCIRAMMAPVTPGNAPFSGASRPAGLSSTCAGTRSTTPIEASTPSLRRFCCKCLTTPPTLLGNRAVTTDAGQTFKCLEVTLCSSFQWLGLTTWIAKHLGNQGLVAWVITRGWAPGAPPLQALGPLQAVGALECAGPLLPHGSQPRTQRRLAVGGALIGSARAVDGSNRGLGRSAAHVWLLELTADLECGRPCIVGGGSVARGSATPAWKPPATCCGKTPSISSLAHVWSVQQFIDTATTTLTTPTGATLADRNTSRVFHNQERDIATGNPAEPVPAEKPKLSMCTKMSTAATANYGTCGTSKTRPISNGSVSLSRKATPTRRQHKAKQPPQCMVKPPAHHV